MVAGVIGRIPGFIVHVEHHTFPLRMQCCILSGMLLSAESDLLDVFVDEGLLSKILLSKLSFVGEASRTSTAIGTLIA